MLNTDDDTIQLSYVIQDCSDAIQMLAWQITADGSIADNSSASREARLSEAYSDLTRARHRLDVLLGYTPRSRSPLFQAAKSDA